MSKDVSIFTFSTGTHRNKAVIFIQFENKLEYRNLLKQHLPHVRWSNSKKIWYVLDTNAHRNILGLAPILYDGKQLLSNISPINHIALQDYIHHLRLKAYSESTIRTYTGEFAQWLYALKNVAAADVNTDLLKSYLLYCIQVLKLSENQIHSRLNALKYYYEQVLGKEKFFFDIPRPKKKSMLPKVFSKKEIKSLFDVTHNLKHLMMLKLAYGMGLRVSEIVHLKVKHIDSERMLVHIENAKGKKDRYTPLPETILLELRNYYLKYKPEVYLFEHIPSQQMSIRTVQSVFKNAMDKAKIRKSVGIHGLRHSYATHLLEQGTDISFIQKLLGHEHIKTTEVYAKVTNTFLSRVISPLDTL